MPESNSHPGPGDPRAEAGHEHGSRPQRRPPEGGGVASGGNVPGAPMGGMADASPSLPLTGDAAGGASAWQTDKRIVSLWSINQTRNSWVGVSGVGWKRLANNSDSAVVALTMLASHARARDAAVNYREEADGMIHEMYVW